MNIIGCACKRYVSGTDEGMIKGRGEKTGFRESGDSPLGTAKRLGGNICFVVQSKVRARKVCR